MTVDHLVLQRHVPTAQQGEGGHDGHRRELVVPHHHSDEACPAGSRHEQRRPFDVDRVHGLGFHHFAIVQVRPGSRRPDG